MLLRLGKGDTKVIILLMLSETQGTRLAAVPNCSKLFKKERNSYYYSEFILES